MPVDGQMDSTYAPTAGRLPSGRHERSAQEVAVAFPPREWREAPSALSASDVVLPERAASAPSPTPVLARVVEVLVAASVLILAAPVMLLLAILVRRGTPGKALFRQVRMGVNCKPFAFVKFRTMYADAKERFPHLYEYSYNENEIRELLFKIREDPRVTPQGRWMRTSTLDELPNFWNVLKGDMALVGPRPEIPEMLPYYSGEQLLKFTVRPGITGLAQISGRGRLSFQDTVKLDVEYVKGRSFLLDLKIVLLTVYKILIRDGAF